jgi:hypothetical protein
MMSFDSVLRGGEVEPEVGLTRAGVEGRAEGDIDVARAEP